MSLLRGLGRVCAVLSVLASDELRSSPEWSKVEDSSQKRLRISWFRVLRSDSLAQILEIWAGSEARQVAFECPNPPHPPVSSYVPVSVMVYCSFAKLGVF